MLIICIGVQYVHDAYKKWRKQQKRKKRLPMILAQEMKKKAQAKLEEEAKLKESLEAMKGEKVDTISEGSEESEEEESSSIEVSNEDVEIAIKD